MLNKAKYYWTKWRKWALCNPLNLYFATLIMGFIYYIVYQLIFNPLEFLSDPWNQGGLKIGVTFGIPFAVLVVAFAWWYKKRPKAE